MRVCLCLTILLAPFASAADPYDHDAVLGELAALRREVAELKAMVASLQDVLAYLATAQGSDPADPAALPPRRPQAYAPGTDADAVDPALPEGEIAPVEPVEFTYSVVREWGRSPAQAAEIGGGASSLKGMVLVVPPGSLYSDIDQLGRDLRTQFGHYDNINIEVFDDPDAAEEFARTNVSHSGHRVLSVSRHRASGRDVILSIRDGVTMEIGF